LETRTNTEVDGGQTAARIPDRSDAAQATGEPLAPPPPRLVMLGADDAAPCIEESCLEAEERP
jgi:hypothetical protein